MSLTAAKRALASNDPVLFGNTYRQLVKEGHSDSALFRLALGADGTLTRDEWTDRVKTATESR
jgi:hypothetical protein